MSAMGNLWPAGRMRPFKLFCVALLKPLKYAYFIEKSTRSVGKVSILALGMTVLHKFGPRTDLGCPWLFYVILGWREIQDFLIMKRPLGANYEVTFWRKCFFSLEILQNLYNSEIYNFWTLRNFELKFEKFLKFLFQISIFEKFTIIILDFSKKTWIRERPHNTYAIFRDFWPPPPFVTQNRTNPYMFTVERNKSLTPPP
jgi:hypothetical protein